MLDRIGPVPFSDPKYINRLISALDENSYAERRNAVAELEKLKDAAEPALRNALRTNASVNAARMIEGLLSKLDLHVSPERLRILRAIEVLEWIGNSSATTVLEKVATGDPELLITREAKGSLRRISARVERGHK